MRDTTKYFLSPSQALNYMRERKRGKEQRLHFLAPLPVQSSLQASSFAAQEAWAPVCILSPNHSTAASSPVSLELFLQLWFSSWPSFLEGWGLFPQEIPLYSHGVLAGFVQLLPLKPFSPGLWSPQISQVWARPCLPCLGQSPPRKTQVHQEAVWGFKADTIPSQSLLKTGEFFSPINSNRDWLRDNVVFNLHLRAGAMQHHISRSPVLWCSGLFVGFCLFVY